jgi:hypothetical protein
MHGVLPVNARPAAMISVVGLPFMWIGAGGITAGG